MERLVFGYGTSRNTAPSEALPAASRSDTAPDDTAELDTAELDTVEVDPAETVLLPAPRPASEPLPGTARPVFVDATGRRLRRLRRVGALVAQLGFYGLAALGARLEARDRQIEQRFATKLPVAIGKEAQ